MAVRGTGGESRRLQVEVALLIGIALAFLVPAGYFAETRIASRIVASRIADFENAIGSAASAIGTRLARVETRADRFAKLLSRLPDSASAAATVTFRRITEARPDGVVRSRRDRIDPATEAFLWIPKGHPLDPGTIAFLVRAKVVVEQVGIGSLDDVFEDAWLVTSADGEVAFMPGDPDYVDRPVLGSYQTSDWMMMTRPDRNPTAEPRWTNPVRTPGTPGWYASVVAPVFKSGEWFGSAGIDVTFGPLMKDLARLPAVGDAVHLIADSTGLILNTSGFSERIAATRDSLVVGDLGGAVADSIAALVRRPRADSIGQVVAMTVGDTLVFASRLRGPNWHFVTIVPKQSVLVPVEAPLRLLRWLVIAVMGALFVAIVFLVARDTRRRIEARAAVEQEQSRFLRLFQLLPVGVTLTRVEDGTIVEMNDAACGMAGRSREEMIGKSTFGYGVWADPEVRDEVLATVRRDGFVRERPVRLQMRGRVVHSAFSARLLEVGGDSLLLSVFRDLTEQRRLEAQLVQSQKLEAVGRLAGGIAHDFNNLMTAVIGYAELLKGSFSSGDERAADVDEILLAARRGATLTSQLLGFARRQIIQPRLVDLNQVVSGLERMLRPLIGEDVVLVTRLAPNLAPVMIDPGQVEQVITNFVVNARDAMPSGGTLTIATRVAGERVNLEVIDTGTGISEEIRPHLFEPFFTTKGPGHGTGLGLATCYGIVRQAGGNIEVDTEVGVGSTFRVLLPIASGEPAPIEPDRSAAILAVRGEARRILVVEDEAQVRQILERFLEEGGFSVVSVADGVAALDLLRSGERFDLVITDVVMPGMGGRALSERLAEIEPGLPIVFMSGYSDDRVLRADIAARGHEFLSKPFTGADVIAKVEAVLSAPDRA